MDTAVPLERGSPRILCGLVSTRPPGPADLLRELEFSCRCSAELAPSRRWRCAVAARRKLAQPSPPTFARRSRAGAGGRSGSRSIWSAGTWAATGCKSSAAIGLSSSTPDLIPELQQVARRRHPPKACHDLKTPFPRALGRHGVALRGVDFDSMFAGFLVNSGRPDPSLDDVYHEYLAPLGGRAAAAPSRTW